MGLLYIPALTSSSNAVQLITSILLLKSRQIDLLQTSLLGTILSNLLLMTGLAFFFGGFNRLEQHFNASLAQTIGMLLLLATTSLVIPTASHLLTDISPHGIVAQSRGTSVVIMISYGLWLLFQLKTNREMFEEASPPPFLERVKVGDIRRAKTNSIMMPQSGYTTAKPDRQKVAEGAVFQGLASAGTVIARSSGAPVQYTIPEEPWEPELTLTWSILTLLISTTLIGFNTSFATDSVEGLMSNAGLSNSFVGLIILPILNDDPLVINLAIQDKMNLCIAYTLERCMQTALLIVPLIVIIAWGMKLDDMTLEFEGFPVVALFASIIIVTYVVQEGKSNWYVPFSSGYLGKAR
jgi:Ca2+:H+ antiporter